MFQQEENVNKMTSAEIQKNITSVQSDRSKWSDTLMKLNGDLATAKGTAKRRISKAIKNAEQQLKDIDKRLKHLDNDLMKLAKTEIRQQDNILLAEQGISASSEIVKSIGSTVSSVTESLTKAQDGSPMDNLTSRQVQREQETQNESFMSKNKMYLIGGAILLVVVLLMRKK